MKRIYAAVLGMGIVIACVGIGWLGMKQRPAVPSEPAPVYAYADLEHVVMSHPRYSEYHRLELEYNAMIAQYQFEQWNYSRKAAAEGPAARQFAAIDTAGTDALNQELQAKLALKENELNNGLQQQYEKMLQEKKRSQPVISGADSLKIVNLQLKLQNLSLSAAERQAAQAELQALMQAAGTNVEVSNQTAEEISAAMAPYREQAKKELETYGAAVKAELEQRRTASRSAVQQQMAVLQDRPDPAVWNQEWKERLDSKKNEMNRIKEDILADIRSKAAAVAQEQGIDMIFGEYAGVGTARDVTVDIIAKLA